MTNDFHRCRNTGCWFHKQKVFKAIWPLVVRAERGVQGMRVWSFYVNWSSVRGTRVNNVNLCEKHHQEVLHMYESEAAGDVLEQEVTESWLMRTNSKMLAPTSR